MKFNASFVQENNRDDRCYNVAIAVSSVMQEFKKDKTIDSKLVREIIRENLKLPQLVGESCKGDMRAHGDACGGHGLLLEQAKKRGSADIILNSDNLKKCNDFITEYKKNISSKDEIKKFFGV
jgi:hypothetical protein